MNNIMQSTTPLAVASMSGASGASPAAARAWPGPVPARVIVNRETGTSNFRKNVLLPFDGLSVREFEDEMASIYASLAAGQEPLGEEFESVWDANVLDLYVSP